MQYVIDTNLESPIDFWDGIKHITPLIAVKKRGNPSVVPKNNKNNKNSHIQNVQQNGLNLIAEYQILSTRNVYKCI